MTFSEDEVTVIVEQLDKPCWSCRDLQGETVNPSLQNVDKQCGACDGSGYTLTVAGTLLLEFINRHTQRATQP